VQTPLIARFSTVIHERGSPETLRDPRGFAIKFYTREGNFDMVGNNIPVREKGERDDWERRRAMEGRQGGRAGTAEGIERDGKAGRGGEEMVERKGWIG
jgi:hypothetical protein